MIESLRGTVNGHLPSGLERMVGIRLGGIDPSVLRELSGVYKPFVKAFKELVSNAFDADADHVSISFADDFSTWFKSR